jgi:hypothetical protein
MNQQTNYAAPAPSALTAPAASAGSSTDDPVEVSSCFVSSPSSSTSSSRFASGNVRILHHHQHHQQHHSQLTQHPPLHAVLHEPRQGGLFPHLSHLGSNDDDDDDSLRVSSSTLFHDGATTAESNVTAPDSPGAAGNRNEIHPVRSTRADRHQEGTITTTTAPTTTSRAQSEPLHNDVYECLCSPAAASEDSDSGTNGGGGGFFAPRHFKRRIADTLMERMRSRADTTSAMMAMVEVDAQGEPHPASHESKKRTFHSMPLGRSVLSFRLLSTLLFNL